jgi:hypothetical protein
MGALLKSNYVKKNPEKRAIYVAINIILLLCIEYLNQKKVVHGVHQIK